MHSAVQVHVALNDVYFANDVNSVSGKMDEFLVISKRFDFIHRYFLS